MLLSQCRYIISKASSKKPVKFFAIFLIIVYVFAADALLVFAQSDTTAPEILSLDFNPKTIDVSNQSQNVEVVVTARDDLSGVNSGAISFKQDSSNLTFAGTFEIISTINNVTTLRTFVTFPRFGPGGGYTINSLTLKDGAGNELSLSTANLTARGLPTSLFVGNTPSGNNIVVGPLSGITLTFVQVITGGQTTVTSSSSGPTPPSGFKLGTPPTYYTILTTAQFNSPVIICVNYNQIQFKNEKNLKLFHFENGTWVNTTASLDTTNNIICGQVSFFSEFALLENVTIDHVIEEVRSFNLAPTIQQDLLDKLMAAKSAMDRGQNKTAKNILGAFINFVKAQKGKKISSEQANTLVNDAQALINTLGGNFLAMIFKWVLFGWLDKFVSAMLLVKL